MIEDEKARVADTSGRSSSPSGMESSVLRFKNVNFVVPNRKGDDKFILQNVSATVKWGHVLAILGPSGAGKTTLINALTLDAFYGNPYGSVTLNDTPLTDRIFKNHCYVVVQHDKHWPYLTCRETLLYAAELYGVGGGGGAADGNTSRIRKTSKTDLTRAVDAIVEKMGLSICADTRNARLSGGQARRLSIGMALLKRPTLLFLDEPTSGLDAAAADQIMKEIVNVAKNENLIIVCTIHQPSTKVFEGFDQVMVMSKGREAFTGDVSDASPYFESIGHSLPVQTNPAEHFLDLVNADFSDDAEVERILNTWEEYKSGGSSSHHHRKSLEDSVGQSGVANKNTSKISEEISIIFRRHLSLIIRDPILYVGRAIVFLVANTVFALVYLKARSYDQDQALNKMWVNIWHVGVPTNMGVVAVYALNDEFKTIMRESKNGMVSPLTYALAKSIMVIPIIFVFAIFALAIPSTLIMDFPAESFGKAVLLWGCLIYVFECVAECLSVWCDDPIIGMLQFMNFWFASFLFGGFLIPLRDMFWPFKLFYYLMPYGYYIRSQMFNLLSSTTWTPCDPNNNVNRSSICVAPPAGANILRSIHRAYPIVDDRDTYVQDIFILIAIAFVYKVVYLAGVYQKGAKAAHIRSNRDYQSSSKVRPSGQASTTEKQASAVSIVEKMRQPLPPVEVRRVNL